MKIIIADDEINIAQGIERILREGFSMPCKIKLCANASEVLSVSAVFHPDLLITDIVMPGMDGLALIQKLLASSYPPHIIIISGYDQFSYVQTALRYGVTDYLLKPVDSQQLIAQVMRIYQMIPDSYKDRREKQLSSIPFFAKGIDSDDYPGSLQRTIRYTEQNYMKELTLQSIAEELMLSPNYLSTQINRYLGRSFNDLLDYVRLKKALMLLLTEPDIVNAEISYLVGYNNERRLYHAFQSRLGFTPGWFREHSGELLGDEKAL